jgi:hypothetical protein
MLFPTVFSELITYNMIPIAALTAISFAPHIIDGVAKPAAAIAIALWSCGSSLASAGAFFSISHSYCTLSNILY